LLPLLTIAACGSQVFHLVRLRANPFCFSALPDVVLFFLLLGRLDLFIVFYRSRYCNVKYKPCLLCRLLGIGDALLKTQRDEDEWTICRLLFLVNFIRYICGNEMLAKLLGKKLLFCRTKGCLIVLLRIIWNGWLEHFMDLVGIAYQILIVSYFLTFLLLIHEVSLLIHESYLNLLSYSLCFLFEKNLLFNHAKKMTYLVKFQFLIVFI